MSTVLSVFSAVSDILLEVNAGRSKLLGAAYSDAVNQAVACSQLLND